MIIHHLRGTRACHGLVIATASLVMLLVTEAPGADALREKTSLKLIPANAAVYAACLRNREIFDAVISSNAATKFTQMPVYGMLRELGAEFEDQFKRAMRKPANMILLNLVVEMLSDEIFFYGDEQWADLIQVFQEVNGARQLATIVAAIEAHEGGPGQVEIDPYQLAAVFRALKHNIDRLSVPNTVIGFKLKDKDAAHYQINRLEKLLGEQMKNMEGLQGRLQREAVGDEQFLTLKVDGSFVPWHQVPWEDIEEEEGEYDELIEKLQSMEAVISVGVLEDYLVLFVGETNAHLSRMGQGDLLVDRQEFEPLRNLPDRRLAAVSYVSKEAMAAASFTEEDVDGLVTTVQALLQKDFDEDLKTQIQADSAEFAQDFRRRIGEPGAVLEYAYITESGFEGYSYSWTKHLLLDGGRPLTLLDQVGGNPIFFVLARAPCSVPEYDTFTKWIKKLHDYLEPFVVAQLDNEQRATLDQMKQRIVPQLARLDSANRKKLLPALRDGQIGLVVDAKTTSKQWCASMPESEDPLPLPECALVAGVSDTGQLKKGIDEYLDVIDDALGMMHEWDPDRFPTSELPRLEMEDANAGTAYFFPMPEKWGLDRRLTPNVGLSEKVVAASMTRNHTRRLLQKTPLTVGGVPLADPQRPLAMAASLNFAALVDAVEPWVDYALAQEMKNWDPQTDSFPLPSFRKEVKTAIQILRCFRGVTCASYVEDKALVTHFEWRFEDLMPVE